MSPGPTETPLTPLPVPVPGPASVPAPVPPVPPGPALERLDRRLVPYWMIVNLVTTAVLAGALAAGVAFLRGHFPAHADWFVRGGVGLSALLLALAIVQPPLAWLTWRYAMDDELLFARHGILFREEKAIPISRLQHVDLRRGPIERLFSLATLVVFTAGTEGAAFRVPGLTVERARAMRDRILTARGDDVI